MSLGFYLGKGYVRRMGLRPLKESWIQSGLALGVVSVLGLAGVWSIWVGQSLTVKIKEYEAESVVAAFLRPDTKDVQIEAIRDSIRVTLGAAPDVEIVNSNEFLNSVEKTHPDLKNQLDQLGDELSQIVPQMITITGQVTPELLKKISENENIERVESSHPQTQVALGAYRILVRLAWGMGSCLLLSVILAIVLWARQATALLKPSLTLTQLFGGGLGQRKTPGLMASFLFAMISMASLSVLYSLSLKVIPKIMIQLSPVLGELQPPPIEAVGALALAVMGISLVSAWIFD